MTNEFAKALYSDTRNKRIPEAYDCFAPFIGAWDIVWTDHLEDASPRSVKGEWLFARVLDGTAVQDLFIVPSRAERLRHQQPDAEYGTTLRLFNPQTLTWDIFYGCMGSAVCLTGSNVGDEIVLTENTDKKMRYVFYAITRNAFRWRKELLNEAGTWQIVAQVTAERR